MAEAKGPPARPRVVAVAQQKGGTGKTTIVCNLAAVIARIDPTIQSVIVDLDSQGSASLQMTGQSHAKVGSWDYVIAGRMPKGFIRRTHFDTCLIIPATNRLMLSDADMITQDVSYAEIGRRIRQNMRSVDLIIIDCPAGFGAVSTMAMAVADVVLMPTQPAFFAVKSLRQTIRHMERLRRDAHDRCAIALSMVDANSPVHATIAEHIRGEFKKMVLPTAIPLDDAAEEAASANGLVVATAPRSPSALAFRGLAVDVLRRAGIEPKFEAPAAAPAPAPTPNPPPAPAPASAPTPAPAPAAQPSPPPAPQPAPAALPPIPPPPGLGGPALSPRTRSDNAGTAAASPSAASPRLPTSPHDPPPKPRLPAAAPGPVASAPSRPASDRIEIAEDMTREDAPAAAAPTPPPDPIPEGLRAPRPSGESAGTPDAGAATSAGQPASAPGKRRGVLGRVLSAAVGLGALLAGAFAAYTLIDSMELLITLGAAALVAVPVLGYVFYVLKRV